jgi:hypothetical protein
MGEKIGPIEPIEPIGPMGPMRTKRNGRYGNYENYGNYAGRSAMWEAQVGVSGGLALRWGIRRRRGDIDQRFGGFRNDIRVEAEFLEEVP